LNKTVSATGETHKVNLSLQDRSRQARLFHLFDRLSPGRGSIAAAASHLIPPIALPTFEIGWKTGWFDRSLYWNARSTDEEFNKFQFSFLGPTADDHRQRAVGAILGVETNIDWRPPSS